MKKILWFIFHTLMHCKADDLIISYHGAKVICTKCGRQYIIWH